MRNYFLFLLLLVSLQIKAQDHQTEVLTLGTFHFDFPNKDVVQVERPDQIDVLNPKYQNEINLLVKNLEKFNPTVIVVECPSSKQAFVDSLYNAYLKGDYALKRSEVEQIGFRLGKNMGVKKLHCVDEWGEFNTQVDQALFGKDTIEQKKFTRYYEKNAETALKYRPEKLFKEKGIVAELIRLNNPDNIRKSLGNYLIGSFKYESKEKDFFGVNFETGRWFNRNLKIFRNVQRIEVDPEDKILIIYGAGHLNILNQLFDSSPEFKLINTNSFLRGNIATSG